MTAATVIIAVAAVVLVAAGLLTIFRMDENRTNDAATWPLRSWISSQPLHTFTKVHTFASSRIPVFHHTALCIVLPAES